MIHTTIREWRARVNTTCCLCVDSGSLEPLFQFIEWAKSVGYDPTPYLPPEELTLWAEVHKMIVELVDLKDRWAASDCWLVDHGFTSRVDWDRLGRGDEARSVRGLQFGLRIAEEASN